MKTREIPRNEWKKFFNNLSRRQEGCQVKVEVFGPEIGDQVEENSLFFSGATAEVKDRGAKIELMIGARPASHLTHVIKAPVLVEIWQSVSAVEVVLLIKSADVTNTLFHLN